VLLRVAVRGRESESAPLESKGAAPAHPRGYESGGEEGTMYRAPAGGARGESQNPHPWNRRVRHPRGYEGGGEEGTMYRAPTGCGERERVRIRTLGIEGCGTRASARLRERWRRGHDVSCPYGWGEREKVKIRTRKIGVCGTQNRLRIYCLCHPPTQRRFSELKRGHPPNLSSDC